MVGKPSPGQKHSRASIEDWCSLCLLWIELRESDSSWIFWPWQSKALQVSHYGTGLPKRVWFRSRDEDWHCSYTRKAALDLEKPFTQTNWASFRIIPLSPTWISHSATNKPKPFKVCWHSLLFLSKDRDWRPRWNSPKEEASFSRNKD